MFVLVVVVVVVVVVVFVIVFVVVFVVVFVLVLVVCCVKDYKTATKLNILKSNFCCTHAHARAHARAHTHAHAHRRACARACAWVLVRRGDKITMLKTVFFKKKKIDLRILSLVAVL